MVLSVKPVCTEYLLTKSLVGGYLAQHADVSLESLWAIKVPPDSRHQRFGEEYVHAIKFTRG